MFHNKFHNKFYNKFLFDIYQSVKTFNKDKMDYNTMIINKINNKYNQIGGINDSDNGGINDSDNDVRNIMQNLGIIEKGFLDYFNSLQTYIEIYLKNAKEFEKLLNDRLSIKSIEKLKKSMSELNSVLSTLK